MVLTGSGREKQAPRADGLREKCHRFRPNRNVTVSVVSGDHSSGRGELPLSRRTGLGNGVRTTTLGTPVTRKVGKVGWWVGSELERRRQVLWPGGDSRGERGPTFEGNAVEAGFSGCPQWKSPIFLDSHTRIPFHPEGWHESLSAASGGLVMLNLSSAGAQQFCDGLTRRGFLQVGSLGAFGLSLSDLLRNSARGADSAGRTRGHASNRSVILIWQHGGPSQLDTFDMKPEAPAEVRGPWRPVASSLPGLDVCELCPEQGRVMDRCSVIRSFSHGNGDHWAAAHWMLTGRTGANGSDRPARQPSMGSVAAHLLGPRQPGALASVNMNDGGFGYHGGAWLGVSANPFGYGDYSYGNEAGKLPTGDDKSFSLVEGLTSDRLNTRVSLQQGLDSLNRRLDTNPVFRQLDRVDQQAVEIVLSGRVREAFQLDRESQATRDRYGDGWGAQALLARRLIEAGVRFVSLNTGYWDDHGNIKGALDNKMPRHDRAVGVLIQDLAERGMLDDTLVISAGEFGRTPVINKDAGRDHWPQAQSVLLAGGGYRHGQVIGSTNAKAEYPTSRKVGVEDFCAIVYHALGLKSDDSLIDRSGRPMHLLPGGEVPRELL